MTGVVSVRPGATVALPGAGDFIVRRFVSATRVEVEHTSSTELRTVLLSDLECSMPPLAEREIELAAVIEPKWEAAKEKFNLIKAVRDVGGGLAEIKKAATGAEIHWTTLYRWIRDYSRGQLLTNLYRKTRSDAGDVRLPRKVEAIMRRVIRDVYMKDEKRKSTIAFRDVDRACKKRGLPVPSLQTFKVRIASCNQTDLAEARGETDKVDKRRLNEGSIPNADFPYALVQIDHTLVDLELVDEENRISIGRPWITVAIDVYSRMCVGYYVSFDPPGMLGTGLCLSHAFLNKLKWMQKLGVDYEYPCMGVPGIIHADNAKEFRGKTLHHACEKYGASLQFRKVKKPRYGAHIERLMGALMSEIHALPGTTFSNSRERGDYDSAKNACMTLKEFEVWLANLILGSYHHKPHSGIGDEPPIVRHKKAIVGVRGLPVGEINLITDEERLYYDFLPMFEQTVQPYGAQLDKIHYSADVLRRWVGAMDQDKPTRKRRFIFRRDPRDISALLFFDPDVKKYFRVPYRNLANPHISVWELRKVRTFLKALGKEDVDEETIFKAHAEMRRIEAASVAKTRAVRHSSAQKEAKRRQESPQPEYGAHVPGQPQVIASSSPAADSAPPTAQTAAAEPRPAPARKLPKVGFDETETF